MSFTQADTPIIVIVTTIVLSLMTGIPAFIIKNIYHNMERRLEDLAIIKEKVAILETKVLQQDCLQENFQKKIDMLQHSMNIANSNITMIATKLDINNYTKE